jgi:serine/threonine-protein kinase HipA
MSKVKNLEVFLHNQLIGSLTLLPNQKTIFSFHDDYINRSDRPTLSLSFKDEYGSLITSIKPGSTKLPPFFSNVLPEGHLREYLARQAGIHSDREFFLLKHLGEDLPGALRVLATDEWPHDQKSKDDEPSSNTSSQMHFSLAGVQLKFSAAMESSGGLTIPTRGTGGHWILKLPSSRFQGVPENEFSMMKLASEMGMDIPEVKLVNPSEISGLPEGMADFAEPTLAIKRFDRSNHGPIHMEDFAQVFGVYPHQKYERASYKNLAEVLWLETGEKGIVEFTKRLVFNTLIGNADMHLKNWSLIYPDKVHAELSPGYDFISTIAYIPDDKMALNYVKTKKRSDFSLETLSHLAAKASAPESIILKTAQETVNAFLDIWHTEKKNLPLTKKIIQAIEGNMKTVPIMEG